MKAETKQFIVIVLLIAVPFALMMTDRLSTETGLAWISGIVTASGVLSVGRLRPSSVRKASGPAIAMVAGLGATVLTVGCSSTQGPTQNRMSPAELLIESNTAQSLQGWPDGSMQITSTAPESAQIAEGAIDYQGTSLSALAAIGPRGINLRNPGNFSAGRISMSFGEPLIDEEGSVLLPVVSIEIEDVHNEVTTVVDANTDQVAMWVGVLGDLSEDQAAVKIEELERDKVITEATAGAVREALGIAGALIP